MTIDNNAKAELDALIKIAKNYRDNTISMSMILDVLSKYKREGEALSVIKDYLLENGVEISNNDDVEDYDTTEKIRIKPYDTKLIDISPKTPSLDSIIKRLEYNEIDLMPDFQRKAGLWTPEQKSRLIESLILRIPLPAFYFDGSDNGKWIVIDGLQRLTALKEYFVDKSLKLVGLEFISDLEGTSVEDLPRAYSRRMLETQLIVYIINPGAPIQLKYNIFKRINTGGLELEPQEIRHALYQGRATHLLKELADLDLFKKATGYSINTERMLDREFVLRFIAFSELSINQYRDSIDDYLNLAMEYIDKNSNDQFDERITSSFQTVLNACVQIFGQFAFRRMPDQEKRRPINKALFENWTSILARCSRDDLEILMARKEILINLYMEMNKDKDFTAALAGGKTSDVRKRKDKITELVVRVLNHD